MKMKTDHSKSQYVIELEQDLNLFLQKNAACQCNIVALNINNSGKKNVFMIRGKLNIKLTEINMEKLIGFKFVLPQDYPSKAPLVYLDEAERPEVVEMVDYLDKGN